MNKKTLMVYRDGSRTSITVDPLLYDLFCLKARGEETAKSWIQNHLNQMDAFGTNNLSAEVSRYMILDIADKRLRQRHQELN